MIVKVRSHTVYNLNDDKYKCEVWYKSHSKAHEVLRELRIMAVYSAQNIIFYISK